jgi:hypothetical protein
LGIEAGAHREWKLSEDVLLGKMSDAELARKLKRTVSSIENRRQRLGIRAANPGWRRFTPEEDALLGTMPDAEIARRTGRHWSSVQARRYLLGIKWVNPNKREWTEEELRRLRAGKEPDETLARAFNRTPKAILSKRLALHIPKPKLSA